MKNIIAAIVMAPSLAVASDITTTPLANLDWQETQEGVEFAALQGDRFSEEYIAMVSLPHGLVSPTHTKSQDMFGIIVSGAMTHVPAGTEPQQGRLLTAGAYYHIPAGVPHVSSCLSAEDCVTFLYQPGAFDFRPVGQ